MLVLPLAFCKPIPIPIFRCAGAQHIHTHITIDTHSLQLSPIPPSAHLHRYSSHALVLQLSMLQPLEYLGSIATARGRPVWLVRDGVLYGLRG
ncbi:predicted protein [Plenodomus lingam JN3]|uniref:Predicted protein n=1 Tax=Leptosphaeria maculans (strain JN3 / isolate v23.1.3 / race Av1-4-5-6-7-8) TaxID=985895 RepID=E5ACA8_LEPMJ|nr:predicted protein [Plenodomus lingam JN3]CBY02110.1 predicted protein [Plenodomus lingam JN3]